MVESSNPVNPKVSAQITAPNVVNTAPNAANPLTAGAVASSNGSVSSDTQINSLADLKKKAPALYQKMMEGIGMKICNDMRDHQERLKKLMRESTQGA